MRSSSTRRLDLMEVQTFGDEVLVPSLLNGGTAPGKTRRTRLVEGIEHLNFLSDDLDRLAGFYERVFEPRRRSI